jgi:Relaxase/Mobilisation nuclease domain
MIAVASSGRRFAPLLRYLEEGKAGECPDRIQWASVRNLAVGDPRLAARVMQATAEANPKIHRPVYHVAISFHPDDVVTRETMERVANHLLTELKGSTQRSAWSTLAARRARARPGLYDGTAARVHSPTALGGCAVGRRRDPLACGV